jgi:hypothetical protein
MRSLIAFRLRQICARLVPGRQLGCATLLLVAQTTTVFAAAVDVVRPLPEAPGDTRYDYYWQLLVQAMTVTEPEFGPFMLRQAALPMTEPRALNELETGRGSITVLVHGNVADYERRLLPIRFPLDKGLLGYRVFLIRGEMQSKLDLVAGLGDLRRYSIGQGRDWGDVTILRQAGFTVVEGTSYEGLFSMLAAGRFELFSRSVTEVDEELSREKPKHPEVAMERHLMLFYPLTRYFYVTRSSAGEELARRISAGLGRLLKIGLFDRMFDEFKEPFERHIGFRNRLLMRIGNPLQTPETPLDRAELWYDPKSER